MSGCRNISRSKLSRISSGVFSFFIESFLRRFLNWCLVEKVKWNPSGKIFSSGTSSLSLRILESSVARTKLKSKALSLTNSQASRDPVSSDINLNDLIGISAVFAAMATPQASRSIICPKPLKGSAFLGSRILSKLVRQSTPSEWLWKVLKARIVPLMR